jgi:hypothetical protein
MLATLVALDDTAGLTSPALTEKGVADEENRGVVGGGGPDGGDERSSGVRQG